MYYIYKLKSYLTSINVDCLGIHWYFFLTAPWLLSGHGSFSCLSDGVGASPTIYNSAESLTYGAGDFFLFSCLTPL